MADLLNAAAKEKPHAVAVGSGAHKSSTAFTSRLLLQGGQTESLSKGPNDLTDSSFFSAVRLLLCRSAETTAARPGGSPLTSPKPSASAALAGSLQHHSVTGCCHRCLHAGPTDWPGLHGVLAEQMRVQADQPANQAGQTAYCNAART